MSHGGEQIRGASIWGGVAHAGKSNTDPAEDGSFGQGTVSGEGVCARQNVGRRKRTPVRIFDICRLRCPSQLHFRAFLLPKTASAKKPSLVGLEQTVDVDYE